MAGISAVQLQSRCSPPPFLPSCHNPLWGVQYCNFSCAQPIGFDQQVVGTFIRRTLVMSYFLELGTWVQVGRVLSYT